MFGTIEMYRQFTGSPIVKHGQMVTEMNLFIFSGSGTDTP